MKVLEINLSKKKLFKLTQVYSFNQIINEITNQKLDKDSDVSINENDYDWFMKSINKADAEIQRKIAHILDHNSMLSELKMKLSQTPDNFDDDNIKYLVFFSHELQLHLLSDAIEAALIAEVYKSWCSQKNIIPSSEYSEIINNLHSISLMTTTKVRKPYILS